MRWSSAPDTTGWWPPTGWPMPAGTSCCWRPRHEVGGAVRSDREVHPDFVSDTFSAFYPMGYASPVLRGLGLEAYGLSLGARPGRARPSAAGRDLGAAAPGSGADGRLDGGRAPGRRRGVAGVVPAVGRDRPPGRGRADLADAAAAGRAAGGRAAAPGRRAVLRPQHADAGGRAVRRVRRRRRAAAAGRERLPRGHPAGRGRLGLHRTAAVHAGADRRLSGAGRRGGCARRRRCAAGSRRMAAGWSAALRSPRS